MEKEGLSIFIQTPEENAKGSGAGKWLELPTGAGKLADLLRGLGADSGWEPPYVISSVKLPFEGVEDAMLLSASLDELNMLGNYLNSLEDFEISNLQAILQTGVLAESRGAGDFINLLYEDNMNAFNIIDASDAAALGEYWAREVPEAIPECMTPEEYGRQCVAEEKGVFTEWGYVYQRMALSREYDGAVPIEYRIAEDALANLRSMASVPVYPHTREYAQQNGEWEAHHRSRKANEACAQAIDKAINDSHYDTFHYDLKTAARTVIEQFGIERVNWLLAGCIHNSHNDGRYSRSNQAWAEGFQIPGDRHGGFFINAHPCVIDGFVDKVREANNHLQAAEMSTEQNYNMIDGRINNLPPEPEQRPSATARLEAAKREVKPPAPGGAPKDKALERN